MYDDARMKIYEIAEHILTLRYQPMSNDSDYLKLSNLKECKGAIKDLEMVDNLLEDHGNLLKQMRTVIKPAEKNGDEGSIDLVGAYIRELEKTSWMLNACTIKKTTLTTKYRSLI